MKAFLFFTLVGLSVVIFSFSSCFCIAVESFAIVSVDIIILSFNKLSFAILSVINESVIIVMLSFIAVRLSACISLIGLCTTTGFGTGILNAIGTEYLHLTFTPWSEAGFHLGIPFIRFMATESSEASSLLTTLGLVMSPFFSTTNCITTTPSILFFLASSGYFRLRSMYLLKYFIPPGYSGIFSTLEYIFSPLFFRITILYASFWFIRKGLTVMDRFSIPSALIMI